MKKLFVGNLSWDATEETLRPLFEECGEVLKVNVVMDQYTGRSRGFGFVEMGSPEGATKAIAELNDKPVLGRNLRVSLAQERTDRGGPGGNGGGRSGPGGAGRGGPGRDRDSRGGGGGGRFGGGGGGGGRSSGGGSNRGWSSGEDSYE